MAEERPPQWIRIFQMITGLILGFVTFVTAVVNFVKLWQGDTRLVTIILFISTVMMAITGCAYVGGTALEGSDTAYIPITESGERAVVIVSLIAPAESGHYRTYWQMEDPAGNRFGEKIWIDFIVAP